MLFISFDQGASLARKSVTGSACGASGLDNGMYAMSVDDLGPLGEDHVRSRPLIEVPSMMSSGPEQKSSSPQA